MSSSQNEDGAWLQKRRSELLDELVKYGGKHRCRGEVDKWLHIGLIVTSVVASGAAAIAVSISPDTLSRGFVAALAAIPALTTVLAQQLHCVAAANLHFRGAQRADSLRLKLEYELPPSLRAEQLADISKAFAKIEEEATAFWEKETAAGGARGKEGRAQK